MQNVSSSYLLEIKKPSRSFECRVTIGENIYNNSDIINITVENVQPSDGFTIGAAVSKSLELTLNTSNTIYSNSTVKLEIGLKIDSKFEYVLIGNFHIEDIVSTDYSTKLTCYDNMIKFEKPYFSNLGKAASLKDIVNELAEITGVEFTGSLPSYNLNKLEGFTCREILGFAASICGGNAYITRDGKFTIKTVETIDYSITSDNYIDLKSEKYLYKVGAVTCKVNDKELTKGSLSNSSMEITFENPWVNDSILTDIYNKLKGFEYIGYSLKWQGDFALDIGDIITLTDKKGITRQIPILSQKFNYSGGLTSEIGAKGESKNKNEFSQSGKLTDKVNRVVTELLIVNEALINKADIGDLKVVNAEIENLIAQNVTITGKLTAIEGEFGTLKANVATIDNLTVTHEAKINDLTANKASITQLEAVNATIDNLEVKVGKIDTLVNGNLTSGNIQAGGITGDSLNMKTIFVEDANIISVSANKIDVGELNTSRVKIKSGDGGIEIVGSTQQFKDKNNKVRIQMGKDTQGNFNFIIRGEDGITTLIDHTGIKENAIADDLIKENMVAEDAVGEKQINYSSFITGFNKDTNTNTIKSTKIMLNNQNQTLDIAFNQLKTQSDGTKTLTESHSTTIGVMQGQISTAINNTQIIKDGQTILLKDDYNRTVQTLDSISSTIGQHTTKINEHTGKITGVETRVNTVERDLNGTKSTVSSHTIQISGLSNTVSEQGSSINQLKNKISLKVEQTDITNAITGLKIGGTNLARYTDFTITDVASKWTKSPSAYATLTIGKYENFGKDLPIDAFIKGKNILRLRSDIAQMVANNQKYAFTNLVNVDDRVLILEPQTEYTLSFWTYLSGNTELSWGSVLRVAENGSTSSSIARTENISEYTGSFVYREVTFKTDDNTKYFLRFYNQHKSTLTTGDSDIHLYNIKLEKGNKATPWSVCPLDIQTSISNVKTEVTADLDGFRTEVSNNYYSKDAIDGKGYATNASVEQTVNNLEIKFQESGGYNLLYNGEFKRDIDKWTATSGLVWSASNGGLSSPSGYGIRLTGVMGASKYLAQYMTEPNIVSNSSFTLSAYVYVSTAGGTNPITDGSLVAFRVYSRITYTDDTKEYKYAFNKNASNTTLNKWQRVSVSFDKAEGKKIKEITFSIEVKDTTRYFYISQAMLESGKTMSPWSPNPNEIFDGITQIDKDGITVTSSNVRSKTSMSANGFKITKIDTNEDVFKVNSDGTLSMLGSITTRTSGARSILTGDGINFYNGGTVTGKVSYDTTGAGTTSEAKNRLWLRSLSGYALKLESAGDMSITPASGKKVFIKDVSITGGTLNVSSVTATTLEADTIYIRAISSSGTILMHTSLDGNGKNLGWSGSKFNQVVATYGYFSNTYGLAIDDSVSLRYKSNILDFGYILDDIMIENHSVNSISRSSNIKDRLILNINKLKECENSHLFINKDEFGNSYVNESSLLALALLEIKKLKEEINLLKAR